MATTKMQMSFVSSFVVGKLQGTWQANLRFEEMKREDWNVTFCTYFSDENDKLLGRFFDLIDFFSLLRQVKFKFYDFYEVLW